jgi:hypothetical protein
VCGSVDPSLVVFAHGAAARALGAVPGSRHFPCCPWRPGSARRCRDPSPHFRGLLDPRVHRTDRRSRRGAAPPTTPGDRRLGGHGALRGRRCWRGGPATRRGPPVSEGRIRSMRT